MPLTHPQVAALHQQVVVSVQAAPGEPFYPPQNLLLLAQAVYNGGARHMRIASPEHVAIIRAHLPDVSVMGITKSTVMPSAPEATVYITPTLADAQSVIMAGAHLVAMDATQRPRPNGESLAGIVTALKQAHPQVALVADIATIDEALMAQAVGFDAVSTTLSGYTTETLAQARPDMPDWHLLEALVQQVDIPVILEGRVQTPDDVRRAFELGAFAVVVGSAITRPHEITRRFLAPQSR